MCRPRSAPLVATARSFTPSTTATRSATSGWRTPTRHASPGPGSPRTSRSPPALIAKFRAPAVISSAAARSTDHPLTSAEGSMAPPCRTSKLPPLELPHLLAQTEDFADLAPALALVGSRARDGSISLSRGRCWKTASTSWNQAKTESAAEAGTAASRRVEGIDVSMQRFHPDAACRGTHRDRLGGRGMSQVQRRLDGLGVALAGVRAR